MIMETQNQQPAVNVYPNPMGNSGAGFGDMYGGGFFWIIILFLFAMFSGWGNYGGASAGGGNYIPAVQQGFDQAAVMSSLNGINSAVSNGFANAEISRSNLAMALQNCCCENRAATADLKYAIATENCADRNAISEALQNLSTQNSMNTQRILDTLCQDKIDAKNEKIAELQNQLTMAQLAASQNAQTAAILTDNLAQTQALEQYLAPVPRPAYVVQNPNCCGNYYTSSCGCGR